MSVRNPSLRKALKYTVLAALGIGAGYALGQATGADRMALAASPLETGWQLNNDIAIAWKDTGGTVRNALWLDASNNFQIGGTGITDVIVNNPATFPALGIILSGAGTGVGTLTYTNSATSGTLTFPAVTDTLAVLGTAQTFTADQTFHNLLFAADNTYTLGTAINRAASVNSVLFNVYHASGDTYPSAQLGDGFVKFGVGGLTALNIGLSYSSIFGVMGGSPASTLLQALGANLGTSFAIAPSGTASTVEFVLSNTNSGANRDYLQMAMTSSLASLTIAGSGTSADIPFAFLSGATEAFRFTTTPDVQFSTAIRMWTGSATSLTLTPASGLITIYGKIATTGLGVSPIYASGLLVSIGTTSTTIATYTPTSATGQNFNIKWVLSAAAATTPTLTVSWTDPKAGAQSVTLFSSAMAANSVQSGVYPLVATSAAAITVSASALVAADIFGTATVSQEQ